ncbi:MAG: arylsulfatase [Planctomycetota bacterium]|jgi:arylsulfatase A-like enzyme
MKRLIVCLLLVCSSVLAADRPNVVLIITDDQGYGDLACHGNPVIQTPNLDRLHAGSVRLTNFHVDPTCSPTRGALMSGKYSHRAKVWHTIAAGNHLRASEMTMAQAFEATGYRTGMFGKWHLGANYPYRPMDRGFDEWLGQGDGGTGTTDDYFTNDRVNDHYLVNGEFEFREGFAVDVIYGAAIDFIKQRDKTRPFFAYVSTYIPHSPHTVADRAWAERYEARVDKGVAYFFAGIERVDRNIGLLRQTLEDEGVADNTVVIFMTDNGGTAGVNLFNAGMRGGKGQVYDGGHRVPFFIHWPAGGLAHGSDVNDLNAHFDVLPTLIDLCDLTPPSEVDFDGRSFKRQLIDPGAALPERTLFVETQRTYEPQKWVRAVAMTNRWRLVDNKELYDVTSDPAQESNVIDSYPEVVARLREAFEGYWKRVTPGDRDRVRPVVGRPEDPEVYLHASDWYLPSVPWSHRATSSGAPQNGAWLIKTASAGRYRFEVRRWPKEVDAPIAGVPKLNKQVDAWDASGSKPYLIYTGEQNPFKALPVASIRLTVGDWTAEREVGADVGRVVFDVPLDRAGYEVQAEMLDGRGQVIAGAYYVYCRKLVGGE